MKINSEIYYIHFFKWFILLICLFPYSESKNVDNTSLLISEIENFWPGDSATDRVKVQADRLLSNPKSMINAVIEISTIRTEKYRGKPKIRGLTEKQKRNILDQHNLYRGIVNPPAANMLILEWDEDLAYFAQLYADNCKWGYGWHVNYTYRLGTPGQNLYRGPESTGYDATKFWFLEYTWYDYTNQSCEAGKTCGHYKVMTWHDAYKVGCGMTECNDTGSMPFYVVCHYYTFYVGGERMYTTGRPCSKCPYGSLCKDNLCVSPDRCIENPTLCEKATCELKCKNCGILDKKNCTCQCADGWDSVDCSEPCIDEHPYCNNRGLFKSSCPKYNYKVANKYCRKMCRKCYGYKEEKIHSHICCEGKSCEEGFVLDTKLCTCKPYCKGLECDDLYDIGASSRIYSTNIVRTFTILYFIQHFYLLNFVLFQ